MPFTPSHAVVALAFLRTPLVPAAIAIGAMTPDLPLFVRFVIASYAATHDFAALPGTMVIALLLLLIWRVGLRPAARELSPIGLARRLPRVWDQGLRATLRETFPSVLGTILLIASLAIGVASHIVWDLFTHEGRWGSEVLPILDESWGPLIGYKWLQHGSSAIGLVILGVCAILWLRRADADASVHRVLPRWVRWGWWVSLPLILIGAWLIGLATYGGLDEQWTPAHLAYRVLPPACALWGIVTVVLCFTVQLVRRLVARARETA
jgi:Domain of unknown function (DUF4184)